MALAKLTALVAGGRSLPHAEVRGLPSWLQAKLHPSTKSSQIPLSALDLSVAAPPAPNPLSKPKRGRRIPCAPSDAPSSSGEPDSLPHPSNGLLRRASLIGAATLASKILGLIREVVLAAVIGVGPVATAFNHAAVLPRFSASFLGGVNGPIHITATTTLSELPMESRRNLTQKAHTLMLVLGGMLAALTYTFAEAIIFFSAPGLWVLTEGPLIRQMGLTQLKLMTPCMVVAGSVGICFGSLTAEGDDVIPSLSPSVTSIAVIVSCVVYVLMKRSSTSSISTALPGELISSGVSVGTLLQWIILVMIHEKSGNGPKSLSWTDYFKDKDVHKLFALMLPAIFSSSLAQIVSLTDLYFSSFIPGAAAGLSYAHLLAMAPVGILSSTIILPMLPIFSRLTKSSSSESLKNNLQKAILMCMVTILPVACNICVLSGPIICILFQRFIFDSTATSFVSSLLLCYSIGSPFWIVRELYAAVFYSLGDGYWPLVINLSAVLLNGILDWLSITVFGLGAQGVALSTSCVNVLSVLALMLLLPKKLRGTLNLRELGSTLLLLFACCIVSGCTAMISFKMLQFSLSAISILRFCRLAEVVSISLAGFLGMSAFYAPLLLSRCLEVLLNDLLATFFSRLRFFIH